VSTTAKRGVPGTPMNEPTYFVYKVIPPRPTFDLDATHEENEIMTRHVAYWQDSWPRAMYLSSVPPPLRRDRGARRRQSPSRTGPPPNQ
jgi:hypothetical protein